MVRELVVVYVLAGIVDTVKVVRRKHPEQTDDELLAGAIDEANEIIRKGTSTPFDSQTDDCRIFAVDERGDSHDIWSYGVESENRSESEDEE